MIPWASGKVLENIPQLNPISSAVAFRCVATSPTTTSTTEPSRATPAELSSDAVSTQTHPTIGNFLQITLRSLRSGDKAEFFSHSVCIKLVLPQAALLSFYLLGKLKTISVAPPRGT